MKPRIHSYANGGMVKPDKAKGGPPKKITTPGKPGDSGPGGAHPGKNRPKKKKAHSYKDGGKVSSKHRKAKPSMLGSGTAAQAGDAVSGRKRQIEKALKDAGA